MNWAIDNEVICRSLWHSSILQEVTKYSQHISFDGRVVPSERNLAYSLLPHLTPNLETPISPSWVGVVWNNSNDNDASTSIIWRSQSFAEK